jgi:CBS domain-containing protein
MKARDVMSSRLITAGPDTTITELARLLIEHRISAIPIVDSDGKLSGIVSEADLLHRRELGTERKMSAWLRLVRGEEEAAREFIRARGRRAAEIMTRPVATVGEDTPLAEVAQMLEAKRVRRVVVADDQFRPVGIVSRADLVRGLLAAGNLEEPVAPADSAIRASIVDSLNRAGLPVGEVRVVVSGDGVVSLWGAVSSEARRNAAVAAAESTPGVRTVEDHLMVAPMRQWAD